MANVSVDVEVDLDEFETYEIVDEVCRRMKKSAGRKTLSNKEKSEVMESFDELQKAMDNPPELNIEVRTLDDKMKYEHLAKIFNKYSLSYIEHFLP